MVHRRWDGPREARGRVRRYEGSWRVWEWETVPEAVVEEVAYRTPCFIGWQQERWFTHCGDAGEFLAIAGRPELEALGSEAIDAIRQECRYEDEEWNSYFRALDRAGGPTAYIFRCRHCGKLGGYSDCH